MVSTEAGAYRKTRKQAGNRHGRTCGLSLLPPQPHPTVSIIVTVHNEKLLLHRCLDSVTAAALPSSEVIIVADGDTDGSWHVATQYSPQVFRLQTRREIASARNHGAREAHGDILFFVNADVTTPPDAVSKS